MISTDRISLVLGTRNRKKGLELAQLVAPPWEANPRLARLDIQSLDAHPEVPDVVEDADTFAANARKKAGEVARALGTWVLADDSGLAVDALGGAPGVYSARYAGEPSDDEANNRKLLEVLEDVPDEARGAAFLCHLALSDPSGTIPPRRPKDVCRGRIIRELRGPGGAGYDPLFLRSPEVPQDLRRAGSPLAKHTSSATEPEPSPGSVPSSTALIASGEMG